MGFFDSLLSIAESSVSGTARDKYKQMSNSELEQEWNRMFSNKPYDAVKNWREDSLMAILDETYSDRFCRTSWHDKAIRELRVAEQKEKEHQQEEQARLEKIAQQAEKENFFKSALEQSEMVLKLINAINKKQYDATEVWVGHTETQIISGDSVIQEITYKRYGYPNLEDYQIDILTDYLVDKLALKYEKISPDRLELKDAPGGMKTSW